MDGRERERWRRRGGRGGTERLVKAVRTLQLRSGGFAGRSWQSEGGEGRGQLAALWWGEGEAAELGRGRTVEGADPN